MRVPPTELRRHRLGLRGWLIGAAVVVVVLIVSVGGIARFYTDYLWFQDVGFSRTWRGLIAAKVVPAVIFSAAFFALVLVNLVVADRIAPRFRGTSPEDEIIERYRNYVAPYAGRIRVLVALFFAIVMGAGVSAQWRSWILFSHAVKFGVTDDQFHKDVGFYVFRLPFEQFTAGWVFAALLVVLVITAVFHYLNGGIRVQSPFQRVTPQVKVHLSVLLALMALTKTVQYYLSQFSLTLSHRGFVDGATYTDVHAQLPALKLLIAISIAAAGLFIVNIWRRGWVFPIIAVGLWGFISIVVGTIYPAIIQRFTVQPNELARESPYIARNIKATRAAFQLDRITTQQFPYSGRLDQADVRTQGDTLGNIRLWDQGPIQQAYTINQRFLPFYKFVQVDLDRYKVGDEKDKPVLASVRELDASNLPDKSWTNQHLVYTHGYGAVAAAADQQQSGFPSYVLASIPPTGELRITQPGVYFGENLDGYAVVDTKVAEQEISGTSSTRNVQYGGKAGVEVSSFLRRVALALRFGDWNLFVSGQVTGRSRVIYIRDIVQRVQTAAPFLKLDADPYPIVLGGRIVWVLDAYTTTNRYPYSQSIHPQNLAPGSGLDTDFNYVRNSVKATIDAYDGTVNFYVVDPSDPIIRAYRKAFPELFKDVDAMPAGLRDHWRYPEDVFSAQTQQYTLYHMTDPTTFFRKQDLWDVAPTPESAGAATATPASNQPAGNNGGRGTTLAAGGSPIAPLYLTMQVPGGRGQEFVLERSFVPRTAANLTAFVLARNDTGRYGQLVLYTVVNSSGAQALSPSQAAGAIESDQFISGQFTLLGQAGSRIFRGDVQLIPIGNTILYARPIWVEGQTSQAFPQYRFVAATLGGRAVLGCDVNDAVTALVSGQQTNLQKAGQGACGSFVPPPPTSGSTTTTTPGSTTTTTAPSGGATLSALVAQEQQALSDAQAAFGRGDTAAGNADLGRARAITDQINQLLGVPPSTATTAPPAATSTTAPQRT